MIVESVFFFFETATVESYAESHHISMSYLFVFGRGWGDYIGLNHLNMVGNKGIFWISFFFFFFFTFWVHDMFRVGDTIRYDFWFHVLENPLWRKRERGGSAICSKESW